MIIDSNIIIYAAEPRHIFLREFIGINAPSVSIVSYIEVLGYGKLTVEQKVYFQDFFDSSRIFPVNKAIAKKAIALRQERKITLGDSVIAATALLYNHILITRNKDDFKWIHNLTLLNPFENH
jgi:toxin FitB